ncbi:PEP-CTERM sorting domain-containing protein, partial [Roseateles sp. P5_E8]
RNTGVVGAFEGATFNIGLGDANTLIDNRSGRIETGAGSVISLSGSHPSNYGTTTILGGAIAGGGRIDTYRFAVLDSLAIEAGSTVRTGSGSSLGLLGNIANDGLIEVYDGTNWLSGNARLWIGGDVLLSGGGQVKFLGTEGLIDSGGANAKLTLGSAQTLTTAVGAQGTVKVDVVNQGRFESRGAGSNVQALVSSIRNTGVLAATDGATFNIGLGDADTLIDNTGGRIDVGAGSFITLSGGHPSNYGTTTIRGGTLTGAGHIAAARFAMLDGSGSEALTIAAGATARTYSGSSLGLAGSIVNHGTLEVFDNTNWTSGPARLWVSGEVALTGTGRVRFIASEGVIDKSGSGSLLSIGAQQTVTTDAGAAGLITVNLVNQGRIEARGADSFLQAQVASIRNTGVLAAMDGSLLNIGIGNADTLIDNTGGRIEAGAGSSISLSGSHPSVTGVVTIRGGTLAGAGRFDTNRFAVLDSLAIEPGATVRSNSGSSLYLAGTLSNQGTLEVFDGTNWLSGNARLLVNGTVNLQGSGRLLVAAGNENLITKGTADALLAIGSQQTLTTALNSAGVVQVDLLNHGRVEAHGAGSTLDLRLRAITNQSTLAAADGADLRIGPGNADTVIDNHGGRIEAGAGSRVFLADAGHPANTGITTVQGGVLGGTGTFSMYRAQLTGGVRIAPGQSPGLLSFSGPLQFDPLGGLQIEVGGLVPGSGNDRVNVAGSALLAGALELSLWGGFKPDDDDVFTILSAASVSGAFANVLGGRVAFAGGSFDVQVSTTDVKLMHFEAAPVPEPGTLVLMLGGLLLVARRRRFQAECT